MTQTECLAETCQKLLRHNGYSIEHLGSFSSGRICVDDVGSGISRFVEIIYNNKSEKTDFLNTKLARLAALQLFLYQINSAKAVRRQRVMDDECCRTSRLVRNNYMRDHYATTARIYPL